MNDGLENLVQDALFNRRDSADESCLTHNVAGVELAKQGSEALPAIERALERNLEHVL
jgi:hypothetical protein